MYGEQGFDCSILWNLRYAGRLKVKKRDMVVESEFHHKEKVSIEQTWINAIEESFMISFSQTSEFDR